MWLAAFDTSQQRTEYFGMNPTPPRRCKLHIEQEGNALETNHTAERFARLSRAIQNTVPDPGVDVPLNKELGSNSIPRFFLTDLRFLFENPKE